MLTELFKFLYLHTAQHDKARLIIITAVKDIIKLFITQDVKFLSSKKHRESVQKQARQDFLDSCPSNGRIHFSFSIILHFKSLGPIKPPMGPISYERTPKARRPYLNYSRPMTNAYNDILSMIDDPDGNTSIFLALNSV